MSDTERYINADKAHEFVDAKVAEGKGEWAKGVPYEWAYALTVIDNLPAADVVPASEVDKIENAYNRAIRKANKNAITAIQKAKQEVAREIFEEIERIIANECLVFKDKNGIRGYVDASVHYAIAELKKKYTEGDGEDATFCEDQTEVF